jgi:hypothetical protein
VPFRRTPPPSAGRSKQSPIVAEVLQKCGFNVVPVEAVAANPPALDELYGNKVLVMQAPSQMVVPLKASVSRLTGAFGIQEGAYTGDNPTDGADVIILWRSGKQVRELFRLTLFPGHRARRPRPASAQPRRERPRRRRTRLPHGHRTVGEQGFRLDLLAGPDAEVSPCASPPPP